MFGQKRLGKGKVGDGNWEELLGIVTVLKEAVLA